MPVFRGLVQTNIGDQYVSNIYHLLADDLAAAATQLVQVAGYQAAVLPSGFAIDRIGVSTLAKRDNNFYVIPVNIQGTRSASSDPLPMYCRFRVDFTIGYRRPLRKFLLVPLEGDQNSGQLSTAARTFVNDNYITPMLGNTGIHLVSETGIAVTGASTNPAVGMHQLRRKKRKKQPII